MAGDHCLAIGIAMRTTTDVKKSLVIVVVLALILVFEVVLIAQKIVFEVVLITQKMVFKDILITQILVFVVAVIAQRLVFVVAVIVHQALQGPFSLAGNHQLECDRSNAWTKTVTISKSFDCHGV